MSLEKCGLTFANGMPEPAHVHACICEVPCPGSAPTALGAVAGSHACECGQRWTGGLGQQARLEPQEPAGAPELPPHVSQALQGSGEALVALLEPWVAMVRDRDEALAVMVPKFLALQTSLAEVLAWMERAGVRPNWATDVRTLEQARALLASLEPEEPTT